MLPFACLRLSAVAAVLLLAPVLRAQANPAWGSEDARETLSRFCVSCHSDSARVAGLSLERADLGQVGRQAQVWEKVVKKLRAGTMPPAGLPRPADEAYAAVASWLESQIDNEAAARVNPGRTESLHRLNRTEYANAVRDLLFLEVDVSALLPADDIDKAGFDNIADVLTVSPALLERYLSAARKTARLAVGATPLAPVAQNYYVPILLRQDDQMSEELPFGSRGGVAAKHYFPLTGEYDLEIRLHRNYVNYVRGMGSRHELQVRLDGALVKAFSLGGEEPEVLQAPASYAGNQFGDPEWEEYMLFADSNLRVRFSAEGGRRVVGVSFVRKFFEPDGVLQPRQTVFASAVNEMRDGNAAVERITITGPFRSRGPGDTPSRQRLLACRSATDEEACARESLTSLARRAYRRPVDSADLETLMRFYRLGHNDGGHEAGIQLALERLLISPDFLFRIERDPPDVTPGESYALSDLELASRLSFFLWSSIPDAELLDLAERGDLSDPATLEKQARRMLADSRSSALVSNFAAQWLYLRNLRSVVPDGSTFPEWDESLREAFLRETELFVHSLIREDRSLLNLIDADYTFANERLASHYEIPGVYGSHFRRVALGPELARRRGGILGHGSLLTVTSYPNRTSPVLRGKWLLANLLGAPPKPPPADVPDLPDRGEDGQSASVRKRLERHREDPACASCHAPMDPLGFALENYDAIGAWRTAGEGGLPVDTSGKMPDGTEFGGPAGLRSLLLERREQLVDAVTEKLLAYAIGRGTRYFDRPAVRSIIRSAAEDDYRWSSIIIGVVKSAPFRMRTARLGRSEP